MKQLSVLRRIVCRQCVGIFLLIMGALFFLSAQVFAAPYAYITIYGGNTVRVMDTADNTIGDTIIVGDNPHGIAVNPTGTRVYVGNWTSNDLSVIDTSGNSVIATVAVGTQPYGVAVSPDGSRAYVTNRQDNSVSVIETLGNTVERTITVGTNPRGVVVHPDSTRAYVTNFGVLPNTGGDISIVDPVTGVIGTITTLENADHPRGIAIHPDGSKIYVSNYRETGGVSDTSNVKEIETTGGYTVTRTWAVEREPNGLAINPAATRIYVANSESNSVSVIDMDVVDPTSGVIATVTVADRPVGVSVTPDGQKIYVTLAGNTTSPGDSVAVINAGTNTVDATYTIGAGPVSFGQFIVGSAETFSIGGSVSGLADGNTVVLQNNNGDDYPISQNGGFSFRTGLANFSTYAVTVQTQPTSPNQTCTINNDSGAIDGADITTVQVTCSTDTYTVGGAVSGLDVGQEVVLRNNGDDDLTMGTNTGFTFATPLADGSTYDVTVFTQPTGQTCSVSSGSGTLAGANVTSVQVTCSTLTYSVGGEVSGLAAGNEVTLQVNSGDDLVVDTNGVFTFTDPLADNAPYAVTVLTQPTNPNQICTVNDGSGTISGADITGVQVICSTETYTIGGTASGLDAGKEVILRNNGADDLAVDGDGPFTFATPVADGSSYNVTIFTQPVGQVCTVGNGTGTVNASDVTGVGVSCVEGSASFPWPMFLPAVTGDSSQ